MKKQLLFWHFFKQNCVLLLNSLGMMMSFLKTIFFLYLAIFFLTWLFYYHFDQFQPTAADYWIKLNFNWPAYFFFLFFHFFRGHPALEFFSGAHWNFFRLAVKFSLACPQVIQIVKKKEFYGPFDTLTYVSSCWHTAIWIVFNRRLSF